ncbi:hypothetical protein K4F52_008844 [Lecanicillium sp. MT-2017a]|nr:hypothetical protein K4F52_008844 [Lecanicillium sp. MT-2017a]
MGCSWIGLPIGPQMGLNPLEQLAELHNLIIELRYCFGSSSGFLKKFESLRDSANKGNRTDWL